jgi:hypothetical protein
MEMENTTVKRPIGLTILCVLSIIGGSYWLSVSFEGYMNPESIENIQTIWVESIEQSGEHFKELSDSTFAEAKTELDKASDDIKANLTISKFKKVSGFWMFGSFCTIVGAFLMFRRKRLGFHFYVAGSAIMIIGTFLSFGFGYVGWVFNGFNLFFGFLFSFLYWRQLKHMS